MEQIKGSLGSQMQTQQQQQNQSKKKSKNKRKSSKTESNTATKSTEEPKAQKYQQPTGEVVENGLTDQLKQQLHIGKDNNSSSSSSSKSSSNNKVNGLMTESMTIAEACPPTITTTSNDNFQQQPALNGHHVEKKKSFPPNDDSPCQSQAVNKKTKRKLNNKKNSLSIEDNKTQLENGHCLEKVEVATNGFSHLEPTISPSETESNIVTANKKTLNTPCTENVKTTSDCSEQLPPKEEQATVAESVTLSKTPEEATGLDTKTLSTPFKENSNTKSDNSGQEPAKEEQATAEEAAGLDLTNVNITYKEYESELQMHDIMRLIQAELSEPYSIYTYRYFIYNWPKLCFLAAHGNEYVGAIVCKLDMHMNVRRGYIAMLAVRKEYRKLKIGTTLVQKAIEAMLADKADEVVLETEMSNFPALRLYENLGFVRDKRLFRYYLNGVDALRLKLWFR